MTFIHGKNTITKVGSTDISAYVKTSNFEQTADVHDVTGGGATGHAKQGGLLDGKFTCGGTYDNTASTGPRAKLQPLLGTTQTIIRQPEGTGTGKAQDSFSAVVSKYAESAPVDDMITWSAEFEISGTVNSAPQ
jgi:hypothetical protein